MKYHEIDNDLIKNFLIKVNPEDEIIKKNLIDWHLALNKGDEEECSIKAKILIKSFVDGSLDVLGINPDNAKQNLFNIYGSLEKILRIAIFLREDERIRDHLNHTIRNILFSIYLMDNVFPTKDPQLKKKLILACAFHDIAYPIEKLKKVAKQIISSTLKNLINSDGKIDINISEPDKLLELIDFVGNDFGIDYSDKRFIKNAKSLKQKINTLFCHTIIPAIAEKGIFEAKHCRSSTVILLRYLFDYSNYGKLLVKDNIENILDVCFAISYHDRDMDLSELDEVPEIVKILRVTDELQEWDRDLIDFSYCSDASLETRSGILLYYKMKDKAFNPDKKCSPYYSIRDKIRGVYKCLDDVTLSFEFPNNRLNVLKLKEELEKYFEEENTELAVDLSNYDENEKYNAVDLNIKDDKVTLRC